MKNKKEDFKNNLEGFSPEFIQRALNYFNELEEEMEAGEYNILEEVLDYYNRIGSYTCNSFQSELNLINFREDLYLLYIKDSNNFLEFYLYFENIEHFEISILYSLYFNFYPNE